MNKGGMKEFILNAMRSVYFRHIFFNLSLIGLFLLWPIDPQAMFYCTVFYAIGYLAFVLKFKIRYQLIAGILISTLYLTFFKEVYHYNTMRITVFRYPLFPLIAWPVGLTMISYYVTLIIYRMKIRSTRIKIGVAYIVFIVLLVSIEYIGYHYGNIRLVSHYPAIPLIDCMHMPTNLKIVYFSNGLIFFVVFFLFFDENRKRDLPAERIVRYIGSRLSSGLSLN
jgi:hypothetical protein